MIFLAFIIIILTDGTAIVDGNATQSLTFKNGSVWGLCIENETVVLPEDAHLLDYTGNGKVYAREGKLWVNFSERGCIYYELHPKEEFPSVLWLLGGILVIIGTWLAVSKLKKRVEKEKSIPSQKETQQKEEEKAIKGLSEKEKKVLIAIMKYPGIRFKDLQALTEMPKSSLSYTLNLLKGKGFVKEVKKGLQKAYYPENL